MNSIKVFAPATSANVSCGFDVLGFAIEGAGDTLEVSKTSKKGITIVSINGPGNLSTDPDKNVCGVVAKAMLTDLNYNEGITIKLTKGILPGSGMGSSAASSAGAAFAVNELFGKPFNNLELVKYSMLGEQLASGSAHADNVAPCIYGGFVIVRSYEPLDIISVPVPLELYAVIVHPKVELRTELSRNVLKKQVDLKQAIRQWGNVAGLIAGLYSSDYELIGRSLHDYIVEPVRALLIPGYSEIRQAAITSGALGCGISGSGPSIFSLCKGEKQAEKVGKAMSGAAKQMDLVHDLHVSPIAKTGCKVI
jgi:homoserine kinase